MMGLVGVCLFMGGLAIGTILGAPPSSSSITAARLLSKKPPATVKEMNADMVGLVACTSGLALVVVYLVSLLTTLLTT